MPPRARTSQNIFMELRKICQHPYLVAPELENESLSTNEKHRLLYQSSGKLAFLKVLLPKLKERGHRVLLFSQFKIALDWIQDFLAGEGYKFLRLDGDIQQAQRQKSMDAYNAPGSDYFIFLLTTRAGGVGINLATADTVIVYDPDFNPHQDLQAIARSHRYGQNKKALVFKLMTKDSVEEQIVYNGKKKMVLDHLVVQNLGKDNEEEDVSSMLLAGAKALYETNADGTSASDVTYTAKQVEEMIDKVEKEAEAEALVLKDKWAKEDEMTDEEKLAALMNKGSETMNFAFAKIWEMDKGDFGDVEVDPGMEQRLEDEMEDNWMTVWENAEKERSRKLEAEAQLNKKERRKRIDYGFVDTTPKKKSGKIKGGKEKDDLQSREVSPIRRFASSDSEFNIGEGEISADDSVDMEVIPEGMPDLSMGEEATFYNRLQRKPRSELNQMEKRALRKYLQEEMRKKAQESNATKQANDQNGSGSGLSGTVPALTEESFFADLKARSSQGTLNKVEQTALKRHVKETFEKSLQASKSNFQNGNAPGPSTNTDTNRPLPQTQLQPMLTTNGQLAEIPQPSVFSRAGSAMNWATRALMGKGDEKARDATRRELEQAMQAARSKEQGSSNQIATKPAPTPNQNAIHAARNGEDPAERAAFRAKLVKQLELDKQDVENIEREIHESVHGVGTYPGDSGAAQDPRRDLDREMLLQDARKARQEEEDLERAVHESVHGVGTWSGSSTSAQVRPQPLAGPSSTQIPIRPTVPPPSNRGPSLVQMARTASQAAEIPKGQETIKWMWQILQEFGLKKETKSWARMVLPELSPAERKAIYSNLARVVDQRLIGAGHAAHFSDPRHKHSLEALFDQRAPGVEQAGKGSVPKMPAGVGRPKPANGHPQPQARVAGPSGPSGSSGQSVFGPTGPLTSLPTPGPTAGDIARPAAQLSLQTPQQRAALARAALPPPASASTVVTQPRQTLQPSGSQPIQPSNSQASGSTSTTRPIAIPCPFCRKTGHNVLRCAERLARPVSVLIAQMETCKKTLTDTRPPAKTQLEINTLHVEFRELERLLDVQRQIEAWQAKQRLARPADTAPPVSSIISPSAGISSSVAAVGGPSTNGTAVFGVPVPPQIRQRHAGPTMAINGNGNGHAGMSVDDAIAIDDDDETDNVATPAVPPTPALTNSVPPSAATSIITTASRVAPTPSVSTPAAAPPPQTQVNGITPPTNASISAAPGSLHAVPQEGCPMCRKSCGLDIRSCAEQRGGRKALKDRIRKLSTNTQEHEKDALTILYGVYQAWPREETPRKRVKRETA